MHLDLSSLVYIYVYILQYINIYILFSPCMYTGWRRPTGCLKLQVIFRKRATNYWALLRKMTCEDKAPCDLPCMHLIKWIHFPNANHYSTGGNERAKIILPRGEIVNIYVYGRNCNDLHLDLSSLVYIYIYIDIYIYWFLPVCICTLSFTCRTIIIWVWICHSWYA